MKTDCEWNDDDKKCTVQPDALDEYNDVLAGLDKEYNLIPLAPAITRMTLQKRPLIQVYLPGDSVVSCFWVVCIGSKTQTPWTTGTH